MTTVDDSVLVKRTSNRNLDDLPADRTAWFVHKLGPGSAPACRRWKPRASPACPAKPCCST